MMKRVWSFKPSYQVFTYRPSMPSQQPSSVDPSGKPVYQFALIQKQLLPYDVTLSYALYEGNAEGPPLLECRANFALLFQASIYRPDQPRHVLATISQLPPGPQFDAMNELVLEVAPGMDLVGTICLAIAADRVRDDKNKSPRKTPTRRTWRDEDDKLASVPSLSL